MRSLLSASLLLLLFATATSASFAQKTKSKWTAHATAAHATTAPATPPVQTNTLTESQRANRFALKFAAEISKTTAGNYFICPISVFSGLSIATEGASADTKTAFKNLLHIYGAKPEHKMPALGKSFTSASVLFADDKIKLKPDFLQATQTESGAGVIQLDLQSPQSLKTINEWVSAHTQDKISKIVDSLDRTSALEIVSAAYFNERWKHAFQQPLTKISEFTLTNGSKKIVPMMTRSELSERSDELAYYETSEFQALQLPYKIWNYTMYVFLPKDKIPLSRVEQRIYGSNWDEMEGKFLIAYGHLEMPRFQIEEKRELKQVLSSLGLAIAFNPDLANFSDMIETARDNPVYLGQVFHNTYVRVDEFGTEAAASTALDYRQMSYSVPQTGPFKMIVNHPFLIVITHQFWDEENVTQRFNINGAYPAPTRVETVLFVGRIADPPAANGISPMNSSTRKAPPPDDPFSQRP